MFAQERKIEVARLTQSRNATGDFQLWKDMVLETAPTTLWIQEKKARTHGAAAVRLVQGP